jgi:NitT/TauT family transport system permease protein
MTGGWRPLMRRAMNIAPGRGGRLVLALLPFALIALVYVMGSAERRAQNPNDKLLPPVSEMVDAVRRVALAPDRRSGEVVLWTDTSASLTRLGTGLGVATLIGLTLGLAIGVLPLASAARRRWSPSSAWSRRWRSCPSFSSCSGSANCPRWR